MLQSNFEKFTFERHFWVRLFSVVCRPSSASQDVFVADFETDGAGMSDH